MRARIAVARGITNLVEGDFVISDKAFGLTYKSPKPIKNLLLQNLPEAGVIELNI